MPLTTVQAGMMDSTAQYYSFKNRIINGAMAIAQRATSAALQFSSTNYTVLDRYVGFMAGASQSGTFSRAAITDLTGFNYCAKLQRTAAGTNTANIGMGQAIETLNCADLAGQIITFSFYAKAGANFSASGSNVFVQLASGTGTDQSFSNMTGSLWTGQVNLVNFTSQAITTTWARYSFTVTLGATASQIGFQVGWTPVGTAGADDALYITGVQIEKGSTATSFDYRPYGTELALCQRYYWRFDGGTGLQAVASGSIYGTTTTARVYLKFPTTMRSSPTLSFFGLVCSGGSNDNNVSAIATQLSGIDSSLIDFTVAAGTIGQGKIVYVANGSYGTYYIQGTSEL